MEAYNSLLWPKNTLFLLRKSLADDEFVGVLYRLEASKWSEKKATVLVYRRPFAASSYSSAIVMLPRWNAMGEPGGATPPSGSKRGRQIVALEEYYPVTVPTPAHQGSRNIRCRSSSGSPAPNGVSPADAYEFLVYLPNTTSVVVRVDATTCKNLKVTEFVELVRIEQSFNTADASTKQKQREITWKKGVYITDFQGNGVIDGRGVFAALGDEFKAGRGLLLHDNHPDTVHSHSDFWNVTPETHLLEILPQDYSVFSALADELDNSLQAVYQIESGTRLICVDLDHNNGKITIYDTGKGMDSTHQNSISKWGTMGSSMYRRLVNEAIGIPAPYLKPNFGMFGLGGIGAGLHLGGCISVSSKTKTSQRVVVLHLAKDTLEANVKAGSVWKTGGEFRPPTEQELQWSPHGSFTKVEISNLNREIITWRVEEVQRKLKDFYFPYIQNDDGHSGMTSRPVEIRVNGDDLAGVMGGEVSLTNYFSGVGEPFVLFLEFIKSSPGGGFDRANARITCHYFPINKGREAIDEILEKLKAEDPRFMEPGVLGEVNFDNYSRRSIRRLGRLLPRARGGRLPFMEPKKFHKENEVNRHCYKRAKAFIDTDAGFVPTHSKTDLDPNHAFTEALLKLGSGLQTVDSARRVVAVSVTRNGVVIKPELLHAEYKMWITRNHEKFDVGAVIDEFSAVIVSKPHHKEELNIKDVVFRVVYDIKCGDFNWKVGKKEAPIRLKLLKGLPGLNNIDATVLYVTVECFISDGLAEEPGQTRGETRIICRSLGVPAERGSREVVDENHEHTFILGESRAFPIEILFSAKCEVVEEAVWQRQEEKAQNKSPGFIEILNQQESFPNHANLIAGASLPTEIIAVVRPKIWKDLVRTGKGAQDSKRSPQKYIIAESMEMSLVVGKTKYHPPEVGFPGDEMLKNINEKLSAKVDKTFVRKVSTSSTGSNLKGLYFFSTTGNELEHIARATGTYFLFFTLVSAKYQDVAPLIVRINVAPSSKVGKWTICSHPGDCTEHHQNNHSPEMMKVRLGGKLPSKLYLSRFDEFDNPLKFEEIPRDITCDVYSKEGRPLNISTAVSKDLLMILDDDHLNLEIPAIRIGQGNLEPLKPTMQAVLRLIVAGNPVGSFSISVLPGRIASARMKEESEALDNGLHPGHIIEKIIFEVLDSHRNPVSSDEQVKVVLEGFAFQDKVGHTRSVDGNGCLDLSMRLRITAGYGEEASLELRSTADLSLWKKSVRLIFRSLRIKHVPDRVAFGSQLTGIEIEAVDANGQVDRTMDGIAHNLTLDWNPNISVPLYRGVCTLPPIPMCNPGMWDGCVAHTQHSKLKTHISVWVDKPLRKSEKEDYDPMASEYPYAICQGPVASYESKALVLRDAQAPAGDDTLALKLALQSTIDKSKYLEGKLQRLGRKLKKQEDDLERLAGMKEEHEKSMRQYQGDLDMLMAVNPGKFKSSGSGKSKVSEAGKSQFCETGKFKSSESEKLRPYGHEINQIELYHPTMAVVEAYDYASTEDTPGITLGCSTPAQVEIQIAHLGHPPGTHAAAILLHAQRQQDRRIMDEVVGVVALLGAVENEHVNRALSAFLGLENMLAIICRTTRAAECFGILNRDGSMDPNQGLYGLARSRNLPISDRIRVITLADESSFYKRDDGRPSVIYSDPQRLLNMKPIIVSSRPVNDGSLGYAVNLIHLNEDQLRIRIAGRYGLRESLFFVLFGFLEVFDTTSNMLRARKEIKSAAVSLDCGFIRSSNQFEWGARVDPEMWFPTWVPAAGQLIFNMRNLQQGVGAAASPAPAPRRCIPFKEARPLQHKQRKELMKAMDATRQRYIDKGVEENIQKSIEQIQITKAKIHAVSKLMNDNAERGFSLSRRVTGNKAATQQ